MTLTNISVSPLEKTLKTRLIVDVGELCRRLELPADFASTLADAARDFPLLFPESLLNRVEKGNPNDPILAQFLPNPAELERVEGFSLDPLCETDGDETETASSCLLQKYAGRVLAITTGTCAARCRFCFRRHFPKNRNLFPIPARFRGENDGAENRSANGDGCVSTEYFDRVFAGIRADSSIRELIFSGGDPLTLSNDDLRTLLHYIKSLESVKRVRFHSRVPILTPGRIDDDFPSIDDFIEKREFNENDKNAKNADSNAASRAEPFVLHLTLHVNSPNEIDANVARTLRELRRRGYVLTSQTVLLKGINDNAETLATLFEKLADAGVVPYYLHQLDRVQGAAAFEVPSEIGLKIVRELGERLPGYAVPRYVREIPNQKMKINLVDEKNVEFRK